MLPQALRGFVEDQKGEGAHQHHCHQADHQRRHAKAEAFNQEHPQGRENHPAQAGTVVRLAQGLGALLDVPRGDQGINGGGSQCHPANARTEGAGIQHPRLVGLSPEIHPDAQSDTAQQRNDRHSETGIHPRQVGDDHCAAEKVQGDGSRYQCDWPACTVHHGLHVNRRPVKPHAPADQCQDERTPQYGLSKKSRVLHRHLLHVEP